jgi:hypothetical protein
MKIEEKNLHAWKKIYIVPLYPLQIIKIILEPNTDLQDKQQETNH